MRFPERAIPGTGRLPQRGPVAAQTLNKGMLALGLLTACLVNIACLWSYL